MSRHRRRRPITRTQWAVAGLCGLIAAYLAVGAAAPGISTAPTAAARATGTVDSWITQAGALLHRTWTPAERDALQLMAEHESGGDPAAVNTWDRNAHEGHPTKGVLQARDDTYWTWTPAACRSRGPPGIFWPPCNIAACVRYAEGRYGSLAEVPGVLAVRDGQPYVGY